MVNVGVLAYQGSVVEHMSALARLGNVNPVEVRTEKELNSVSGIILPGGESTTIGKLLREFQLAEPLKRKIQSGMPAWGTCAGMILLAKDILDEDQSHLSLMDIKVRRNAYGSQLDSFLIDGNIPQVAEKKIPFVFIRAPWVESVGEKVEVLAEIDGKIVAVEQGNMIATSFHPELSDDLSFHQYFLNKVRAWNSL